MRTLGLVLVLLGVGVGGCKGSANQTGPSPAVDSGAKVEPNAVVAEPDAPASPLATHFWVVGDTLVAYDLDGKQVASLGDEALDHARRLADGRVVGLVEKQDTLSLVVLDPNGAQARRIEVVNYFDPQDCSFGAVPSDPDSYAAPLSIQERTGFGIGAGAACLNLQDRNDNMSSYEMSVVVDLDNGSLEAHIGLDLEGECEGKQLRRGIVEGNCEARADSRPWVVTVADEPAAGENWPADYDETTRSVIGEGHDPVRVCIPGHVSEDPDDDWGACADVESRSPSGRFVQLTGQQSDGDYIYRDLLLLDRRDGTLLQVETDEPLKFVVVKAAQVFADDYAQERLALVGESEVVWLPGDRLWVDGKLLIPERRELVELGGSLAWAID